MAKAGSTTTTVPAGGLLERMLQQGWKFDFFQAVWLLERYCGEHTPVGQRGPVSSEPIRFRPHVSVGFPPTDVRRITAFRGDNEAEPGFRLDVTFMGLYGVSTPLPLHYAIEMLRSVEPYGAPGDPPAEESSTGKVAVEERATDSNPTRDFLDIFHHRLLSLFYRAWTKYRHDVVFGMPGRDTITDYLLWLIGCPRHYDEAVVGVDPIRLIRYAGLLTQHPKSAVSLEGLLFDYWNGVEIRVEQCVGRWVTLNAADLNGIGVVNSGLGVNLTVGEQVYDLSGQFNISVGPVDWQTYLSFLPSGEWFAQMRSLVRLYCSDPLAFTIEVKIEAGEIPQTQLTSDEQAGRLGFTSWALTGEGPETSVKFEATLPVVSLETDRAARAGGGATDATGPAPPQGSSPAAAQAIRT